jgi:hypothetical protein
MVKAITFSAQERESKEEYYTKFYMQFASNLGLLLSVVVATLL